MIAPAVMVVLSLTFKGEANRWTNIVVGLLYTGYNLIGLVGGGYPSAYDLFLIVVGIVFTALVVWTAWRWPRREGAQVTL